MDVVATTIEFPNMLKMVDFSLMLSVEPISDRAKLTLTAPFSHKEIAMAVLDFKARVLRHSR